MRAVAIAAALAGTAAAETTHATLPEGLSLDVKAGVLVVREGKASYRLEDGIISITSAKPDAAARAVDLVLETNHCTEVETLHYTLDQLHARIANAAAYAQHVKKAYAAARPGFARAATLDPAWPIPAYNLASAAVALHDDAGALAALAPQLARDPLATYAQVVTDPELRPLRANPAFDALRVPGAHPRIAVPVAVPFSRVLGYSAAKDLIALTRQESSWGGCGSTVAVELWTSAGTLAASVPLVGWDDAGPMDCTAMPKAGRARVADRAARAADLLQDLGVEPVDLEPGVIASDGDKTRIVFGGAKLGIVERDGTARVLRGNTELATGTILRRFEWATYIGAAHAIAGVSVRPGREGCEGTDPTETIVFSLPR